MSELSEDEIALGLSSDPTGMHKQAILQMLAEEVEIAVSQIAPTNSELGFHLASDHGMLAAKAGALEQMRYFQKKIIDLYDEVDQQMVKNSLDDDQLAEKQRGEGGTY